MSGNGVSVVEVPEFPVVELLPVELSEVLVEEPDVEDDSPELVPAGGVPPDMVNADEVASGPLQARPTARIATGMRDRTMTPEFSAKPLPSQGGTRKGRTRTASAR